ncbi:hypothetical protein [Trujillonella humicola]|uniref:hypothetical protein n=1 Tax=Trujillonella humicola TaxID=3383699 RepID=UPI003905B5D4
MRQAAWTIAAQVLSSVANFGLTIAVARAVDAQVGGAFAYAFLVFSLVIAVSRAVTTDPLTIRFSAAAAADRDVAIAQAASSAAGVGLLSGVVCALVGLVLGGDLGLALLMLAVVLPGQLLQDAWRSAAFASNDARRATVNDGLRVVVQFAGIALVIWSGVDSLVWYMGAWAAGAWAAALLGMWQFRRPSGAARSLAWLRAHAGLSVRLGSGILINMGAVTLTTSLLVVVVGVADTGGLRFAQSVLGPIQVLFGAVTAFMVPLLARRLARSGPGSLRRPAALVSLGALAVSAAVVAVLLVIPPSVGEELLGDSWQGARAVMAAVGTMQCFVALSLGASHLVMAMGRADLMLRIALLQAPLLLALGVGGGVIFGIEGAAWGLAAAQGIGCAVIVFLAWRARPDRSGSLAPEAPAAAG